MIDSYFNSIFSSIDHARQWWSHSITYPRNVDLCRQDTPSTNVYFIESGMVKLTRINEDGNELIAGIRRRHWLVGAPAVLLKKPYSFNVTTLTDCHIRGIPAENFLSIIKNDEMFYMELARILSHEIYEHADRLISLGCMPSKDRLMRLLGDFLHELQQQRDPEMQCKLPIPLKHKEMAQMIAVTPEHLSRLLGKLEAEGLIVREKNAIIMKRCIEPGTKMPA
jgi:CRP/FNR family cyclic AMP-dependent transcriptional regulator